MNTKEYAKYLLSEYDKIKVGNGGRTHSDLRNFIETGTIKDLICLDDNDEMALDMLHVYRVKIQDFSISHGNEIILYKYNDFIKSLRENKLKRIRICLTIIC